MMKNQMLKKHLNIRVFGQVQGVFFRYRTKQMADNLGIKGFVRNETDGTVYIEAEGEEKVLNQFLEWCREGPESAQVERVKVGDRELKNFEDFRVS